VAQVGIKELLEAGVHFGHQTRRWNPKMRRFIYGERSGIYIIDLLQTEQLLSRAQDFASGIARRGGTVLFVGTKKQARDGIKEIAEAAGQPYVNHRWLGGLLTNFQTISLRIKRLHDLERYASEGQLALLPTRERLAAEADLEKLQANLGGVKNMQRVPDAMFVVDLKTEAIAVREAQRLRIPIIGLVDTNCDPDGIDYVVPGNDDAIRACSLITRAIGDVVSEGRSRFRAEEEQARREAEEQARREAEERARREAEEQAAREAEERAAREADERAAAEALTHAGEGEPRDVAEAQVAEAAQKAGREVEGRRAAEAGAAAQAADEPAMPAAGNVGPGRREEILNSDVGDRVPQEAGAAAGEGSPASDTAVGAPTAEVAAEPEAPAVPEPEAPAVAEPEAPAAAAAQPEAPAPAEPEAPTAEAAAQPEAPVPAEPEAPTAEAAAQPEAPSEPAPKPKPKAKARAKSKRAPKPPAETAGTSKEPAATEATTETTEEKK
jgi:small subunit ribosomal protein S2